MAETVTLKAPSDYDTRFFGHPRGLATLFFTEMWERYSFYGTRALLMLYMTHSAATGALGATGRSLVGLIRIRVERWRK